MKSAIFIILILIIMLFVFLSPQIFDALGNKETTESSAKKITETIPLKSNLRWSSFPLNVYIDISFIQNSLSYADDARAAMRIWEEVSDIVSFSESPEIQADLVIKWVSKLKENSSDVTGDAEVVFVDLGSFQVIKKAEINLLTRFENKRLSSMDMTNLVLHEIGHSLGLKHSDSEDSIMFPTLEIPSSEIISIPSADIQNLEDLYFLESRPDIRFAGTVNVSKHVISSILRSRYFLNISFIIENGGLQDAENVTYVIKANGNSIVNESAGIIEIGTSLALTISNIEARDDFDSIEIILDERNSIDELDEGNNEVRLSIE